MIPELEEKVKSEFDRQIDDERPLRDGGTGAVAYAEAICTYVALALGKLTEMSTSVCRWEPIAQCPRTIFARQSISMLMDFAESNPFGESSGSLNVVIDGIHRVFIAGGLWQPPIGTSKVRQLDAAAQLVDTPSFFVSMDPPYYDNVPYADLSDFFYVWLRPSLKAIWPNEFATVLTPKLEELVADHVRFGGKAEAKQHFEHGLKRVFEEVASRATAEVPTTIFYAFQAREKGVDGTASTGWESFLESLISSGLAITATWPIRTENQSRSRAQGANALATSVVLVCRKRLSGAPLSTRSEFIDSLKRELMPNIRIMRDQNIAPVDLAQSAIGPGISVFSRFARVFESDGSPMTVRSALVAINDVLSEILTGEESDLDSISRFAVTWFDQYGFDNGPYGDGEVAARAKNTAMREVVASGIATSSSGKVRLLKYAELDQGWLPASDTLLTTWEVTHHLLRALQQSESHAAELVRMLGPGLSDRSRQLAYLLYQMSEKHGRRDHAAAYNMLVTAWPQIQRLAAQGEQATGEKGMFE
jgi:putative DNA methylase